MNFRQSKYNDGKKQVQKNDYDDQSSVKESQNSFYQDTPSNYNDLNQRFTPNTRNRMIRSSFINQPDDKI